MDIQTRPYGDNVTIIRPKKNEEKLHETHDEMSAIGEIVTLLWAMLFSMATLAIICAVVF